VRVVPVSETTVRLTTTTTGAATLERKLLKSI
jgi:hypothetical protein